MSASRARRAPEMTARPRGALDPALVARVGDSLDGFASTLDDRERAVLQHLIGGPGAPASAVTPGPPSTSPLLSADELLEHERLLREPPPERGGLRPSVVMIIKATRLCNLRCTYCNQWRDGPDQTMRFPVLARAIRDVLRAPGVRRVEFVWHGGEATLLPIDFYEKALWLQQQHRRPGQVVANSIQTNGTRLTDAWLAFLRRHRFSVGVSLDGPPEVHDSRRVDVAGRPTSASVRAGLESLRASGVAHGVLVVVDDDVIDVGASRLVDYLLECGVRHVDLLNVLPPNQPLGAAPLGPYLPLARYVEFLREVFRLWWPALADRIVFRDLAGLMSSMENGSGGTCVFAGDCFGGFLTVDPSGEVSACDKYVGDDYYRFGNLLEMNLADVGESTALAAVRVQNARKLQSVERCPWYAVCNGGCPHDRYTSERRPGWVEADCCGYSALLDDMRNALDARRNREAQGEERSCRSQSQSVM